MQRALELAWRGAGRTRPNPPVGAVVVNGGRLVGEGWHRRAGGPHAEVEALRRAGAQAAGGTLYVTLEPCSTQGRTPPCTERILAAGVARVVTAVRDPNPAHNGRGIRLLKRRGLAVTEGVGAAGATSLLRPFAKWITTGRPFVTLKMGMTLDGRIADAAGRSKWITSPASRRLVQELRRHCDAIMVGAGTVRRDNPSLSLLGAAASAGPLRLLVDACGCLAPGARVLADGAASRTIIATTAACPAQTRAAYAGAGATVWPLAARRGRVSLKALVRRAGKAGLLHVLCEGGAEMAAELIDQDLVDECVIFVAPTILGGQALPVVTGRGYTLAGARKLVFTEMQRVGTDIMIKAVPQCLPD